MVNSPSTPVTFTVSPNPREDQSRHTKLNLPKACARTASYGGS